VWDAALRRIRWLFDEFPEIVVGVSGGKDSTVVFNLSLMVAREKKRLPLKVMFLDQEAEWQATVDQVRLIMTNPDVKPFWYQIPFKLFNATSATDHWLMCWDESKKDLWMHPKEAYSLKENHYGTDRFADMFTQILAKDFPAKTVYIAGVRCEESPSRFIGLTQAVTYKGETWGKILSRPRQQFTFYPIYDWSFSDVWKAIHDNGWHYNALYDSMFQYGVNLREMRVSNVHHETAVKSLFHLQEIEPETYQRLTQRIAGIDMAGKFGKDDYFVHELPYMFKDWREYRDYLLENLIDNPDWRSTFKKRFKWQEKFWLESHGEKLFRMHIQSILTNDWEQVKLKNFERNPHNAMIRQIKQGKKKAA
jgi:predicted phosphoadenosine phosphosulfate sulfurtransferase